MSVLLYMHSGVRTYREGTAAAAGLVERKRAGDCSGCAAVCVAVAKFVHILGVALLMLVAAIFAGRWGLDRSEVCMWEVVTSVGEVGARREGRCPCAGEGCGEESEDPEGLSRTMERMWSSLLVLKARVEECSEGQVETRCAMALMQSKAGAANG